MQLSPTIFRKTISSRKLIYALWSLAALVVAITKAAPHRHNNYIIFRSSFYHFSSFQPLYLSYPSEHHDRFLYGPVFPILFAPFALLPDFIGMFLWLCLSVAGCLWAVRMLPTTEKKKITILWIAFLDLYTALCMQQLNVLIGACILLSFIMVEKKREWAAALFIALGTLTKIYGIVGLVFFPFAAKKGRYLAWLFLWFGIIGFLPILLGGGSYVFEQYSSWIDCLGGKNTENFFSLSQNVSLLGIVRKVSGSTEYSDLLLLLPGIVLFALPFIRFRQYRSTTFRMNILASTLLFTVLFSTGSESSTYIIALLGVGIWFAHPARGKVNWLDITLLVGTLLLSSLSPTDLFPAAIRKNVIQPLAMKALFPSFIWIKICIDLLRTNFVSTETNTQRTQTNDSN
ncbi:glycosyltransferase family 87 protein [Porphyromonas loveana]|uniref:glycosyltransferase family 87 protein n=1 Tax=Porphyromonas loveana TaxID=1884669 RepID=UPI00359FFFD5